MVTMSIGHSASIKRLAESLDEFVKEIKESKTKQLIKNSIFDLQNLLNVFKGKNNANEPRSRPTMGRGGKRGLENLLERYFSDKSKDNGDYPRPGKDQKRSKDEKYWPRYGGKDSPVNGTTSKDYPRYGKDEKTRNKELLYRLIKDAVREVFESDEKYPRPGRDLYQSKKDENTIHLLEDILKDINN